MEIGLFPRPQLSLHELELDNPEWAASPHRLEQQDSAEAVQIKARLFEAPDLAGSAIDVDLKGDRVILNGFVETSEQRERAEAIAQDHEQVNAVENNITVK